MYRHDSISCLHTAVPSNTNTTQNKYLRTYPQCNKSSEQKKQRLRRALVALYVEDAQLQVTTNEPRYYKHAAKF